MKTGTIQLGNASIHIGYSQIAKPNQRGFLRELSEFNVPEEFRGRGEGSNLLSDVCLQADQTNTYLLLLADNQRLKDFYSRFKFNTISSKDDMLMVRVPNS
jgi:predicted GNAT family N-acyltransferase